MDLPSHLSFGLAVALIFYGRPEVALLVGLGTLVPDLDREYWYVREKKYGEEQYHRARFHNVFLIVLGYLISPFFSLRPNSFWEYGRFSICLKLPLMSRIYSRTRCRYLLA